MHVESFFCSSLFGLCKAFVQLFEWACEFFTYFGPFARCFFGEGKNRSGGPFEAVKREYIIESRCEKWLRTAPFFVSEGLKRCFC